MAVTSFWFGKAILNAFGGETAGESTSIDYLSDNIYCALFTAGATPIQDTMEFFGDIGAEVVTGGEYVSGGKILSGKTLGYTAGTNVIKFAASNVTWAASTITASYAVIYKNSGNPATSPLLGFVDFGAVYTSSAGDFTITWDAGGMLTITAA